MKLKMRIKKIKCIDDLEIDLPIEKGLYAITGKNGTGKSTIVMCASSVFFNMPMNEYLGPTEDGASIEFELNGATRSWSNSNGKWHSLKDGLMNIKGFYEGSLIFGNRFRNNSFEKISQPEEVDNSNLIKADDFVRCNLGDILHNDSEFYENILLTSPDYNDRNSLSRPIFYYEKNGKRISQFHMSTGENLLVSILYSLLLRKNDRASLTKPCIMFLDEIELALHPSSLKKLVNFLSDMARDFNYAVYFSTHSIELISGIIPNNIFYVERHTDNTLEIINPCYPAYATKILYDHNGYDNVILVEDDLAKSIIAKILKQQRLLDSRLVHVLPCGGYQGVISLADDAVRNNLLGRMSSICIILDGDVRNEAEQFRQKNNVAINVPLNFLPIESLEKYLKSKLVDNVDNKLFRRLNDYVFLQKGLADIVSEYKTKKLDIDDNTGKKFYSLLDTELRERRRNRSEIVEMVVEYLFESKDNNLNKVVGFLTKQLGS